jgi:hypothetical protein
MLEVDLTEILWQKAVAQEVDLSVPTAGLQTVGHTQIVRSVAWAIAKLRTCLQT